MRAMISDREALIALVLDRCESMDQPGSLGPWMDDQALAEARRILAKTEPDTITQGVRNRHYALDALGWAGRDLAETIATFLEAPIPTTTVVPAVDAEALIAEIEGWPLALHEEVA